MQTILEIKSSLKPIKDKVQYKEYLQIIDSLIDYEEDSLEEEALELVSILVEDYEGKHYPISDNQSVSVNKKIKYKSLEEAFEAKHQKANEFIKKVDLSF
jgi:HTH-type transcriptional regulator / antitoxin HigA